MTRHLGFAHRVLAPMALMMVFAGLAPATHAQALSDEVMTRCARLVGQMKFEGWPAERNHSMMMLACETTGGRIPGASEETAASPPRGRARL